MSVGRLASDKVRCRVCELEFDPEDLRDHIEDHVREREETLNKKLTGLAVMKEDVKVLRAQKAASKKQAAIERETRKAEEEARKKAAAEDASRQRFEKARARRDKNKKPMEEYIPEKKGNKYPRTGDKEIDEILKDIALKESNQGKKKGKQQQSEDSTSVQITENLQQEKMEHSFNENVSVADTENATEQARSHIQIMDENEVIVTETVEGNSSDSCDEEEEIVVSSNVILGEAILSHMRLLQEMLDMVLFNQKEILKELSAIADVLVSEEGKRIESNIVNRLWELERVEYAAHWDRVQEEFVKQEQLNQERHQQYLTLVSVAQNEVLVAFEQMVKRELSAVVPLVEKIIQKAVSTAVSEAFQGCIVDKAVNQVLKADLEAIVTKRIKTQFQTSGKRVLMEALRSSIEASVIPSFEKSCKLLSGHIDASFREEIVAQQKIESIQSPLAFALRDSINSTSSMTQTLTSELADGQRKLVALTLALVSPGISDQSAPGGSNKVEAKRALSREEQHTSRPGCYGHGGPAAPYPGGANSGYLGGNPGALNSPWGGQSLGYGSLGYGPNLGYGSNVSAPNQSATGASGYGSQAYGYGNYGSNDGYIFNPGGYGSAAGRFGPGGATSGHQQGAGGGYN